MTGDRSTGVLLDLVVVRFAAGSSIRFLGAGLNPTATDPDELREAADLSVGVLGPGAVDGRTATIVARSDLLLAHPGTVIDATGDDRRALVATLIPLARPGTTAESWLGAGLTADVLDAAGLLVAIDPDADAAADAVSAGLRTRSGLAMRLTSQITARTGTLREHLAWEAEAQEQCLASPEHLAIVAGGIL